MEGLLMIIIAAIWVIAKLANEHHENSKPTYRETTGKEIDWNKMSTDHILNNLSNKEVERNLWAGKYDKK